MTILIIEDDEVIRTELGVLLEKYGYDIIMTQDYGDVLDFMARHKPHLILLDINLPVVDGYYICREIRKQSRVPIIVVTSRDSDMDELMSMNLGADDFITKPYNTQILLARIGAVLARAYGDNQNVMTYGAITLNLGKSTVSAGDRTIELTKNELKILSLLMENKGAITSRDDIMNALWQTDEFVDDNTLTVNINRLRAKLSDIGADGLIKTKRGQGYSL